MKDDLKKNKNGRRPQKIKMEDDPPTHLWKGRKMKCPELSVTGNRILN
jgi:hypothetical protein